MKMVKFLINTDLEKLKITFQFIGYESLTKEILYRFRRYG